MSIQTSLKLSKFPALVLAIGCLIFCLPRIAHADLKSDFFNFSYRNEGRFRLFVAIPKGQPPRGGWPIIVLLDGNKTFPIAQRFAPKAALIGVGYPTENKAIIVAKRYYDLTSKVRTDKVNSRYYSNLKTGGQAIFRHYLFDTIIPSVKKIYKVNPHDLTLYGHSLGGYFVLKTFLSADAKNVKNFCAADPSIWWNNHELWHQINQFNANIVGKRRLLIDVAEKKVKNSKLNIDDQKRIDALRQGPNGKNVSEFLRTQKGFENKFRAYAHESHGTLIIPSIADCLNFALAKE